MFAVLWLAVALAGVAAATDPCGVHDLTASAETAHLRVGGPAGSAPLSCAWTIRAPANWTVRLDVTSCGGDGGGSDEGVHLAVYDGPDASSARIAAGAPLAVGHALFSAGDLLFVELWADAADSPLCVAMAYRSVPAVAPASRCAGLVNASVGDEGLSVSDGSAVGQPYANDMACLWHIMASPGSGQVQLAWEGPVDVQATEDCRSDVLEVYDGVQEGSSPLLARVCTYRALPAFTSTAGALTVRFSTDAQVVADGFRARATSVAAPTPTCAGRAELTASTSVAVLTDGSPPGVAYANSLACEWLVVAPTPAPDSAFAWHLVLRLTAVALQDTPGCVADAVTLFDGDSVAAPALAPSACGLQPAADAQPAAITSSPAALVQFRTDAAIVEDGFQLTYRAARWCSGRVEVHAPGEFGHSPDDEAGAPAGLTCEWVVHASDGRAPVVQLAEFTLAAGDCGDALVAVYDGTDTAAPLLLQRCTDGDGLAVGTGVSLLVRLQTGNATRATGRLSFAAGSDWLCAGTHDLRGEGALAVQPPQLLTDVLQHCVWRLWPAEGGKAGLSISQLALGDSRDAISMTVHDGSSMHAPPLLHVTTPLSLTQLPLVVGSAGVLTLALTLPSLPPDRSPSWRVDAQFRSRPLPPLCAAMQRVPLPADQSWVAVTDGSGDGVCYANNMACQWELVAPEAHVLEVRIDYLLLQTPGCADYVWYEAGVGDRRALCGAWDRGRTLLTTEGTNFTLGFFADGSLVADGFQASVRAVPTGGHKRSLTLVWLLAGLTVVLAPPLAMKLVRRRHMQRRTLMEAVSARLARRRQLELDEVEPLTAADETLLYYEAMTA